MGNDKKRRPVPPQRRNGRRKQFLLRKGQMDGGFIEGEHRSPRSGRRGQCKELPLGRRTIIGVDMLERIQTKHPKRFNGLELGRWPLQGFWSE